MPDDLFVMIDPPPGAVLRLRATLRRRAQERRRRRAALGATVVLLAALATLRASPDPARRAPSETVAAFDASLHPALAVVGDGVLPPVTLRGTPGALLRRSTLDPDVVLYELGP